MIRTLLADAKASAAAAALGCAGFAIVELILTTLSSPTFPGLFVFLRFALITISLAAVLFLPVAGVFFILSLIVRAVSALLKRCGFAAPIGLFEKRDAASKRETGAWVWGTAFFIVGFVVASTFLIKFVSPKFKEPLLTAALIAILQLLVIAVCAGVAFATFAGVRRLGRKLAPRLGAYNPFARGVPAVLAVVVVSIAPIAILLASAPHLRPLIPWRLAASAIAIALGAQAARRVGWPFKKKPTVAIAAGIFAVIAPLTFLYVGADPSAKALAVTSSPALAKLVDGVRKANDFDGDGYGSLLGETDCAPFNAAIHPLAPEIADNGRDENCDGRDLELATLTTTAGETPPVPEAFKRDWNILLITVDTIRYDHTSFGGYIEKKGRDTTPNLAELVRRSASFSFCSAPSAGTMASIPAILTSKFFHSGIALGPNRSGKPPVTKPENLLIAEILNDAGYQTGAILTHYYFNDWGLEQGFDSYDNSIGKASKPRDVSSDILTDRAVSWIANHSKKKWFLWTHYLDPHGRYVSHPGEVSYGETEEDIYDGELHFTDKHLGRLFEEIARIPGVAENTVVILTSDHGDAFNEHGFINHGQALYRELLWVPLIVYVPSIQPRVIPGPVSPLDIVPTVLDLVGIDRSRYAFEGQSLVPQLFYGKDAKDRLVFAETDWPKPQRAVISDRYKLIRKLQDNLFELYDLKTDPWEKKNIQRSNPVAFKEMNAHLEAWLERVYYARDKLSNQQMLQLKTHLLATRPSPRFPVSATYDEGRIELLGFDVAPVLDKKKKTRTGKIAVSIYFEAKERSVGDYKVQVFASQSGEKKITRKSTPTLTAKGRFPTSRWRRGEFIRHEALISMGGKPSGVWSFALKLIGARGVIEATGGKPGDKGAIELGDATLDEGSPIQN